MIKLCIFRKQNKEHADLSADHRNESMFVLFAVDQQIRGHSSSFNAVLSGISFAVLISILFQKFESIQSVIDELKAFKTAV